MTPTLAFTDLIDYTNWERQKWHDRLRQHGADALKLSAGPNGDGRFATVGDIMKHVFSAEKRYIDRLTGRPLTDPASIPNDDLAALFRLGQQGRQDLQQFIDTFPADQWDVPQEMKLMTSVLTLTPRKIVAHILLHEIRHWAQISTMLRQNGITDDFHDFLFSSALGGQIRREPAPA